MVNWKLGERTGCSTWNKKDSSYFQYNWKFQATETAFIVHTMRRKLVWQFLKFLHDLPLILLECRLHRSSHSKLSSQFKIRFVLLANKAKQLEQTLILMSSTYYESKASKTIYKLNAKIPKSASPKLAISITYNLTYVLFNEHD